MSHIPPTAERAAKQVIPAAFEVANLLGHGFPESVYQRALLYELNLRGVRAQDHPRYSVAYKQVLVGDFRPDLVVEDDLVVELKACEGLGMPHVGQALNYLRAANLRLALLINFGQPKIEIRRVVL